MRTMNKKDSIRECHCHTWGHLSRIGLFVASWSNTRLVFPNTTPYQHWPALTLEHPSTLVLHCRCCREAPRWPPMRQAAVAVGYWREATCVRGPAKALCSLGYSKTVTTPRTPAAYWPHTWVATAAKARPRYRSGLQELAAPGLEKLRTCAVVHSGNVGDRRRDHPLPLLSAFILPFFPHSSNPLRLHPNRDTGGGGKGEKVLRDSDLFSSPWKLALSRRLVSAPTFAVSIWSSNLATWEQKTTHRSIYDNEHLAPPLPPSSPLSVRHNNFSIMARHK